MTEGEIATLKAWIKEGKPEGEKTAWNSASPPSGSW